MDAHLKRAPALVEMGPERLGHQRECVIDRDRSAGRRAEAEIESADGVVVPGGAWWRWDFILLVLCYFLIVG